MTHPFTIFQAFPWLTTTIPKLARAIDVLELEVFQVYGDRLEALAQKLQAFEDELDKDSPFHEFLLCDPAEILLHRLTSLDSLSAERLSNLVSILLDYRLLDVAAATAGGKIICGQPDRLLIPHPQKMYFKLLDQWPNLVTRGLQLLRECEDDSFTYTTYNAITDPVVSLFVSLVHRKDTIEGHKIKGNFECAAAYLSLILRGVVKLPNNMTEFKRLLSTMCHEIIPADGWDAFFDGVKTVHLFKFPLQLALSVSIICLFLPTFLMTKDMNRRVLLQMWQGLGGEGCPELFQVEQILWRGMFDVAAGIFPLKTRFRSAFREAGMVDLSRVGYPESEWLSGDAAFSDNLATSIKRAGKKKAAPLPSQKSSANGGPDTSQRHETTAQGHRPVTRSVTGSAATNARSFPTTSTPSSGRGSKPSQRRGASQAATKPNNQPPDKPLRVIPGSSRQAMESTPGQAAEQRDRAPTFSALNSDDTSETGSDVNEEPPISDDESDFPSPLRNRKRPLSDVISDDEDCGILKSLKLHDGSKHQIYETIDLTLEKRVPPVIDLTLDDDSARPFVTKSFTLWDETMGMEWRGRFHTRQEVDWLNSILSNVSGTIPSTQPQLIAAPQLSFFSVWRANQISEPPVSLKQHSLSKSIIIIPGAVEIISGFNARTLSLFGMLHKPVQIRDHSMLHANGGMTIGTLAQILSSTETSGKSLAAVNVPAPAVVTPFAPFATDAHAWDMTIDLPWCGRNWEMPRSELRWAEIAIRGACRPLKYSINGFVTHIEVKAGSQFLVVGRPAATSTLSRSSFAFLEQFRDALNPNLHNIELQGYRLRAGTVAIVRPLVPFLLLPLEHTITQLCHFYAQSTLQDSCTGFLHSSLSVASSDNASQAAGLTLLRRLVHYYHAVYFSEGYSSAPDDFPHAPNAFSTSGIMDILTLCNIFEVSNALVYSLTDLDRHRLREARRLCRQIVAWLSANLVVLDERDRRLDVYHGIWMPYLAREVKAISAYQTSLEQLRLSPRPGHVQRKLEVIFRNHRAFHGHYITLAQDPESFSFTQQVTFKVSLRYLPGSIDIEAITGASGDDDDYFGL